MTIDYQDFLMPSIVVASFCIGYVMKHWLPTDDRIIPTVLAIFGIASGFILFGFNYDGFVRGIVSGLAAVGGNQIYKQLRKCPMGDDEIYAMGADEEILDEEYEEAYESEEEDEQF